VRAIAIVLALVILPIAVAVGGVAFGTVHRAPSSGPACGGTPPAAAAALGFTTCAFAIDFTRATISEYDGTAFSADTLSSWLDCKGASHPLFYANTYSGPVNCNDFRIVSDGGTKVLDISYEPADTGTYTTTIMQSCSQGKAAACGAPTYPGMTFPFNWYYEIKMRTTSGTLSSCPQSGCGPMFDDWSYPTSFGPTWTELDFIEFFSWSGLGGGYGATGGSQQGGWNFGGNGLWPNDTTNYHTYAVLTASDGSTETKLCSYYDNIERACSGPNKGNYATRMELIDNTGPPIRGWCKSDSKNCLPPTQSEDHYIEWIHVWSCGAWLTGQCNASPLPSSLH
jgi:hypothetical protein